jgi:hypothetical protein
MLSRVEFEDVSFLAKKGKYFSSCASDAQALARSMSASAVAVNPSISALTAATRARFFNSLGCIGNLRIDALLTTLCLGS